MAVESRVELITPEMARYYLECNTAKNRPINPSRVANWVRTIRDGEWILTHQGAAFSTADELLDGQHRLAAIVEAGIPVQMMVTTGLDPESFRAMDRGWTRTLRQVCPSFSGHIVDGAGFFLRIHQVRGPQPYHVERIVSSPVGEALAQVIEACSSRVKTRASVAIQLAAALRMREDPAYVKEQYRAFVLLTRETISPASWALFRQLDRENYSREERFARAWVAFRPANRFLSKIQLANLGDTLREIRKTYPLPWGSAAAAEEVSA